MINSFIRNSECLYKKDVSTKIYNKEYYRAHYQEENKYLRKERERRLKRAIDLLDISPGTKVLDLGCGDGEFSFRLAGMGALVWGIDYSRDAIDLAREKWKKLDKKLAKRVHFLKMDASHLVFSENFFDRIISIDVFEHVYPKKLKSVLDEVRRVIKSRGVIVIETSPNAYLLNPISFVAKKILGKDRFEYEGYHVNIFNYFKFTKLLKNLPGKVEVKLKNDGHRFFSSRLHGLEEIPTMAKNLAKIFDFLHENPISEKIILSTPLRVFLAHDLWGVVHIDKKSFKIR